MKKQKFYYPKYDWDISAFYDVACADASQVISALKGIGCKGDNLHRAIGLVESCKPNQGITFANPSTREMVVVMAKASNPAQFLNTLVHEMHHMAEFIAGEAGIPYTGEAISYISGDLAMLMHPVAGKFLCPHCINKKENHEQVL